MNRTRTAWVNLIVFLITLAVNTLGGLGLINGLNQKEVSDMFPTLITPAPFTFSIWGVIYLLILISLIAMIIKSNSTYYQKAIDNISVLFRVSCLFNMAWIVSFSYVKIGLSVLFIFGILISLTLLCLKLLKIQTEKQILIPLTFGLYTGWVFIATVVNISAFLVKINWDGFGIADEIWAVIVLIVAVILVFLVLNRLKNAVFPLPIAWAYLGIYVSLFSPEGYNGQYELLQITALAGMVVLIIAAIFQLIRNQYSLIPTTSSK